MKTHHSKNATDIDNNEQNRIIDINTTKRKNNNDNDNDIDNGNDDFRVYRI